MIIFSFKASLLAVVLSCVSVAPVEAITAQGVGKAAAGIWIAASSAITLNQIIQLRPGYNIVRGNCSLTYEILLHPAIAHPRKMLLRKAILDGHVGLAKLVLAAGVDASVIPLIEQERYPWWSDFSISALGMAVLTGNTQMVRMFLDAGADVDQVLLIPGDFASITPYHTALSLAVISERYEAEIVKMLLDAGAKLDTCKPDNGKTLIYFARNDEIRDLLLAKKAEQEAAIPASE